MIRAGQTLLKTGGLEQTPRAIGALITNKAPNQNLGSNFNLK